ncbi:MAG: DEAD/DEAH box helicase, partial [Candidatus Nanopelagicales bacterium]
MTSDRLAGGALTWEYPADLPVSARRDDIMAALAEHQVVIVAGETGSGKTTQLPKMALAAGVRRPRTADRGRDAGDADEYGPAPGQAERPPRIAHTQPRRIAARAVAERIAEELNVPLGSTVGYRVRFTDETSDDTLLTVMTDGLLLASIRQDRLLQRFDTIIVDEAHERSLSIDFLLGYLAWLLPQRPDLRVIVTSATLETSRFAEHFGDAPVIEVSGRTYPVQVRYRPRDDADGDEVDAVCAAVEELLREPPGDVLVFLSGEREIRDTLDALRGRVPAGTELLPLYGR